MDMKRPAIFTHCHVFVHIILEFPDLVQDRLQQHLAGSQSGTYVSSWIMTDPPEFFLTGLRVSSFLAPRFLNPSGAFKSHVPPTDSGEEPEKEQISHE